MGKVEILLIPHHIRQFNAEPMLVQCHINMSMLDQCLFYVTPINQCYTNVHSMSSEQINARAMFIQCRINYSMLHQYWSISITCWTNIYSMSYQHLNAGPMLVQCHINNSMLNQCWLFQTCGVQTLLLCYICVADIFSYNILQNGKCLTIEKQFNTLFVTK